MADAGRSFGPQDTAAFCYLLADAMLTARQKGTPDE
jgi:hypothetical protein